MFRKLGKIQDLLLLIFKISLPLSIVLYVLRGLGFLGFVSGGVLSFCILTSIFSLLGFLLVKTYI